MNTKKEYITPELTVVSFKVEMGFNASNTVNMQGGSNVVDPISGLSLFDDNAQEVWGWNDGGADNTFGGASNWGTGWN